MNDSFQRDTAYHVRLLVDNVPSMLAYWDRELRCRFANRAYERWFGVVPDDLIGTSIRDLLGSELFAANEPYIRAALKGEQQVFERVVPGPDGVRRHSLATYIPDICDGQVVGFIAHVTEVTQLKETEAALRAESVQLECANALLRANETALREAQRLGRVGSWEWEIASDITIWSDELYRIFGRDPRMLSPTYAEHASLYTARSWSRLQAAVDEAVRTGEPYTLELEYLRADDGSGWLEARGEALRDEHGAVCGLRGTVHEITLRRQMEETRIRLQVAESASRNKTAMMSRVSHELRTPLNGILGFAQLCQADPGMDPKHRRWAEVILASGEHMLDLVNDLLDISAAESGQLATKSTAIDVFAVLQFSLAQALPVAEASGVHLAFSDTGPGLRIHSDPTRLRQIIDNLLSNAIKYTRAGGRVTMSAAPVGDAVELKVTDTGVGLSPEQINRLFTPFDRLGAENTQVAGTGLGLALTKALVEGLGGTITVRSRAGIGSAFIVSLPARPRPESATRPATEIGG
jgi:PAS domain S-box-containing protein